MRCCPASANAAPTSWWSAPPTCRGATRLAVPEVDERYAPLLDILPMQRLALALALTRGEDPDAPRGLKKVTATM